MGLEGMKDNSTIGTSICPGVFYTIPGDYTGKVYVYDELPFDDRGNRRMGCKIVDSQPCLRCGKCGRNDEAPEMYPASWLMYNSYRLPGVIY
jgi:hypothetical protein